MAQKPIELLVATLFLARDQAHRAHLAAKGRGSYAKHMALEAFYGGIVDLADELVETYQGVMDELLDIPLATQSDDQDIEQTLESQLEYIHADRYEAIPKDWTCLHNIVDEIEALYGRTLYKLRNLM